MKTRTCIALLILFSMTAGMGGLTPAASAVQATDPLQPTRQGAWLDSIVFTREGSAVNAISQLQADELDLYASSIALSSLYQTVLEDPGLAHTESYGSYNELTFNPHGPTFDDGRLNPFSVPAIREAMNRLIDRSYIVQVIMGGMARPRWVPLHTTSSDHTRYLATIEALNAEYAYDPAAAQADIAAEMVTLGAALVGGQWTYNGAPVTLIALIRVEDKRRDIGDYVADQLEAIGFAVERQYKTSGEASPCWIEGDPAEGCFHFYTGGWITSAISRDEGGRFGFFYTALGLPFPLWQAYTPTPEFYEVSEKLLNGDFATVVERDGLFEQALDLALEDSVRIWLFDQAGFTPRRAGTTVVSDLAGGVSGAQMWPYVARLEGVEGGTMRVAVPSFLAEPWNPIAGTNWLDDMMAIRATQDYAFLSDPHDGLVWPQRAEQAAVVVEEGLPVGATHDWVDLTFAPQIDVPADAWVDWDATAQQFITRAEKYPGGLTARVKSTVYYPADLFTTVTWHDGSPLDLADIVMSLILTFDRAKLSSPIYDESAVDDLESFLSHFRGVRIVNLDPLIIETYSDSLSLDAELSAQAWWPNYPQGPGAWHNLAAAIRAEAAGELAFSDQKANQLGVEWMSFVTGPSLDILEYWMDQSATQGYIPYQPTLGAYITSGEAAARWVNLQTWYGAHGHFWLGTGPFYLESAQPGVPTLTLQHNDAFPDAAGRWDAYAAPPNPAMQINYPSGDVGSYFNVTGSGFPPGGTASIVVNDHLLDQLPVDGSGEIAFTLTTEEARAGTYHLRTTVNPSGGVQFVLEPDEPVRPKVGDLPLVEVPDGLITYRVYLPLLMRSYDAALLYFDDFSDPKSGWWIHDDPNDSSVGYQDGEYEVKLFGEGGVTARAPIDGLPGSFSSEADMRLLSGAAPAYGLALFTDASTEYNFKIQPVTQVYWLWYWDGSQWSQLANGLSGHINPGNATNHLKMEWTGHELAVYVNGHLLTSTSTAAYGSASQGIVFHDGPAIARYDNFEVRRLP
jgi:peptide/nickel transport system substrate-binding protein